MKNPGTFSEELFQKVLQGISLQKYSDTVLGTARAPGISPSSRSWHIIEMATQKLKEFKERDPSVIPPFAICIDTIHRSGEAFMAAQGIDKGHKQVLGFWQGATENHELGELLLSDMEIRGLSLSKKILWITDGGRGIIKTLKDRFGKKLLHQWCTIHKDRNIQRHRAKKYRKEVHRCFKIALEQNTYEDARS